MFNPNVAIRITANGAQAESEIGSVAKHLDRLTDAIQRVGHYGVGLFSGWQIASVAQDVVKTADTMTMLDARLKLATKSQQEFNTSNDALRKLALQNQQPLESTITLFSRLAPAIREAGGSQAQAMAITQSFADALRVGGANAAASESAMLQFSQAMASGVLRGDEFNSIAEASPRIMKAMADGMNVPVGTLRKMAEEGKLTADVVGNALMKEMEKLRTEAASMPITVGGAMTNLRTNLSVLIGDFDRSSGASKGLADSINFLAGNIGNIASLLGTGAQLAVVWVAAFMGLPKLLTALAAATGPARLGLIMLYQTGGAAAVAQGILGIGQAATAARAPVSILGTALRAAFSVFAIYEIGKYLWETFPQVRLFGIAVMKTYSEVWEHIKFGAKAMWEGIKAAWNGSINWIKERFADLLSVIAKGLSYVPGMGDASKSMQTYADSMRVTASAAEILGKNLAVLRAQRDQNIAASNREADALADYEIAQMAGGKQNSPGKPGALIGKGDAPSATSADVINATAQAEEARINRLEAANKEYAQSWQAVFTPLEKYIDDLTTAQDLFNRTGDPELFSRQVSALKNPEGYNPEADPEVVQQRSNMQDFLGLQKSLASQNDLIDQQYAARAEIIRAYSMQEYADMEMAQSAMTQLTLQHLAQRGYADAQESLARAEFEKKTATAKTQFALGQMVAMTAGAARNNKAMFQINKAAAIAEASISLVKGTIMTWGSYPYPWNIPMTALYVAGGLTHLSQLKSSQFGGGGSAPSVGGGSVGTFPASPATGLPTQRFDDVTNKKPESAQQITIIVNGNLVDMTQLARDLRPYNIELAKDTI